MVLGFKKQFKQPILDEVKIHTIRLDANNRWTVGRLIHFATGVRTKEYNCFKKGTCCRVQTIEFKWSKKKDHNGLFVKVFIDGKDVNSDVLNRLAIGDGFKDVHEFFEWEGWNGKDFKGKIIHWTSRQY